MAVKCSKCHFDNPSDSKFCGECGTQLIPTEEISAPTETLEAAREELTRGTTFASRYEIIEELGKGGMGKVYRVEDKKIKEEVALKLIKPEIASDKKTIERFSNELKMARKIAHRNVGRMYHISEHEGTHYITMEYVPGEDLKGSIRRMGPLGAGKTIFIAKQVCDGLAEAHRLGVVHRDLKPQNIMIDKDGNARIMDFGIARSIAGKGITGAGVMIGTPEYMSPEQAEVKEVDQRSDIYSLGVILYEMVTGRVPFEGETPLGIAMKHKSEVPKDPKELNAQIPDDLSRVILRCMEKDKEKRYQSAGEVRSELTNIEKGIPTTERVVPKRKPITSKEITVTFGLKKLFIPTLVVAALVIAAVIIWQLLPKKATVPIPSGKPSLAVVYFENNTGDESLEYLRSGLAEWLITDLSQSKFISVLSGDRIYGILRKLNLIEEKKYSSDDLSKVAREGGASHTMKGSFIKIGENFVITVMLQKPYTGEVISSREVRCEGEKEIPEKVDELTRMIKVDLNLSPEQIAGDIDKEIGKITTSFPEAYKYYCEGFKYNWQGNYRRSIQLLEKAVSIDPDFATAYSVMGTVYNNLGYHSKMRECYQKAIELRNRMSDRELYFIQGYFYRALEKTYDKSIEAFKKLLQLYPDDMLGHRSLGFVYRDLEQWDKAIECFEVNIQNKVEAAWPYTSASYAYRAKGLYDKAGEILKDYLNIFPDIAMIHLELADLYLCQGKLDLALTEADRAITLHPSSGDALWYKGYIYLCKGEFREAETEFLKLLESEENSDNLVGRQGFVSLRLLQGRFEEAKSQATQGVELAEKLGEMGWKSFFHSYLSYVFLRERNFDRALQENDIALNIAVKEEFLNRQRDALLRSALIYLEMESTEKAKKAADKLKEIIDSGMNQKLLRMYHFVIGMIELERKNFAQAIKNFKDALSLLAYHYAINTEHALFIEPLAFAYYKSGDLEKAYEEYERIISLTGGRTIWGDIYARSFYMLGKIYEQKGWKGKALENYEKFLSLWKDAVPGITEVEDAKKRLAALKGQ